MAETVWNGSLRLSLVSCPVYLTAATSSARRVKLDLLSARTGNLVTEQFVDTKTGDVVAGDSLVKGYEHAPSRYVAVTDEELTKLGSGNIIDLEQFVPREQIGHLYIDDVYYVHAEGQLAADTVQALRLAMERSRRVAIGHARMGESDRPALIEPHRAGLMMSMLRTPEELAAPEFSERPETEIPTDMVEIAEAIIARRAADFDASKLRDRYQDDLRQLIEQKARNGLPSSAGERRSRRSGSPEASPPEPEPEPAPAALAPPPELEPAPPPPPPEPEPAAAAAAPPPEPEPAPPPPEPEPEPVAAAAPPPEPEPAPPPPEPEPEPAAAARSQEPEPAMPPAPEPESALAEAEAPHDLGAEILLHIMGLGDRRYVEPGWAGNPGSKRQIEALSIRPRDSLAPSAIEFRVFAQEGRATAWVSNGNYAGTRGRNLPLTGFAVRPTSELGERLEIAYEGSFFEGGVVGPKRNGELCVSPVADDPLEAVRVTIIDQGAATADPAE
jgi:DNA end-binding protein Ku